MMELPVRLFDCRLDASARQALEPVLASGALAAGPFVPQLELRLEQVCHGRSAVAMSDMTQALAVALRLSGVGPGSEVMALAVNCMSSNTAIALVGATPVWVDIDPVSLTIDLDDCIRALSPRTKALVVYHVAGYPSDLSAIERFCRESDLVLIEDANAALGARSAGRPVGTSGRFSVVSFYANRQVNAIEGAALLCANATDAEAARRLRRFGVDVACFRDADGEIAAETDIRDIGFPASMSNVNARLACHHLDSLELRLAANRKNAAMMRDALLGTKVDPIRWREIDDPAFWVFFVRLRHRDALMRFLKASGIECSKLHQRNDRYSGFSASPRQLPGTSIFEEEMLALPVGWWLSAEQLDFIVNALRDWRLPKD